MYDCCDLVYFEGEKDVSHRMIKCIRSSNQAYLLNDEGLSDYDSGVSEMWLSVAYRQNRRIFTITKGMSNDIETPA